MQEIMRSSFFTVPQWQASLWGAQGGFYSFAAPRPGIIKQTGSFYPGGELLRRVNFAKNWEKSAIAGNGYNLWLRQSVL